MNLDTTYTIDFNKLSFYDGDFKKYDDFSDLIYESESSSVCREEEWICFNPEDNDDIFITIEYSLDVTGRFYSCPGDRWTPPACDFDLEEVDFTIDRFLIDDVEVELTKELENVLEGIVAKNVNV